MDRRTWLKTGAAGGAAAVSALALDGCAHVPQGGAGAGADADPLAGIDSADVERYLAGIDRRLAWIDNQESPAAFPAPPQQCSPEKQAEHDRFSRLFRKSARTLYLTGCFLEASDEIKTHPGMQERMRTAQLDMDEAVFGTTALLEGLTPENHREIRRALNDHPEIAENLAQTMEAPAREDRMPLKRRYLLRAGILDVANRMKAQSPAVTIDRCVKKVRRIEARGPAAAADESTRRLAARVGEEAFWAHQRRLVQLAAAWETKLAQGGPVRPASGALTPAAAPQPPVAPPVADTPPAAPAAAAAPPPAAPPPAKPTTPAPATASPPGPAVQVRGAEQSGTTVQPHGAAPQTAPPQPKPLTTGQKGVSTGGWIMGMGAISIGVGLIFAGIAEVSNVEAFAYPAVILGVTVGPILLVVGLIVVLVSAIIRASE